MTITDILKKSFQLLKSNFINKQDTEETTELDIYEGSTIDIDDTPTEDSDNLVKSGGVYGALEDKVDKKTIVKNTSSTAIALTPSANTSYIYGELTSLALSFNTANDDDSFHIIYESGTTPTTMTVSTTNAVFDSFTPSANAIVEIDGLWYLDKWVVFFKETKVTA